MTDTTEASDRTVELGNPTKILFPDDGITKRDLAEYYRRVAPVMLNHIRGRPIMMQRFPDGIDREGFYQKSVPDHFPRWIRTETVRKKGGEVEHVVCDDTATLVYLADQGCITLHAWLSTVVAIDEPDRMVFDLDPPDRGDIDQLRLVARAVRQLLDELGLDSRLMTTGSAGFHVVVPLQPSPPFDRIRDFAHRCGKVLVDRHPDEITVANRVAERGERVFVDYLRNAYGQTTVAPYAVRARAGAPVATPIDWAELTKTEPQTYHVKNVLRRLAQKDDPWDADEMAAQSIEGARDRLLDA